jgi:alditol oxidase
MNEVQVGEQDVQQGVQQARRNWAGNHTFGASKLHLPETVAEVRELVASARHVGVVGSGHSFNDIADTPGDLISLERMNRILALDTERRTVTIEAGIKHGALSVALNAAGWSVHNTASLPHISVAGACATATHGSGDKNGNLSTAVSALELVTADGTVLTLSRERDGERFRGAVVGLGALGVVTQMTLDVMPAFQVRQYVYEDLPLSQLEAHFDAITGSGYSVSLFTELSGPRIEQVWVKQRVADSVNNGNGVSVENTLAEAEARCFAGARRATVKLHPVGRLPAEPCTEQLDVPGPWHERLPHFRMDFTPASGAELQSEYFVPRQHALDAFRAIDAMRDQIVPALIVSEVRTIAADDLWLSTCYGRDSVAFHFSWNLDWPAVSALLPRLEARLAPFDARPHWGKLFTTSPARLRELYPKLENFKALGRELDPAGKFQNGFLGRSVFGE